MLMHLQVSDKRDIPGVLAQECVVPRMLTSAQVVCNARARACAL